MPAGGIVNAATRRILNNERRMSIGCACAYVRFDTESGRGGFQYRARLANRIRLAEIFVSTNQTLVPYGQRLSNSRRSGVAEVERGHRQRRASCFSAQAGRSPNPWLSTNLVWTDDFDLRGCSSNYRLQSLLRTIPIGKGPVRDSGRFPLQAITLVARTSGCWRGRWPPICKF